MKRNMLGTGFLLGVAMAGVTLLGANEATACGGEWIPALEMMQVDYRPQGVARAEKDLEKGNYRAAAGAVIRMMPHIKSLKAKSSSSIVARAQRVLAVAIARSAGTLDVGREVPEYVQDTWLGKTPEARRENLQFAVSTLTQLGELKDHDPAVQTELGEAMAELDDRHNEAKGLLEKLAAKDLIATPEGYATLAKLRRGAGDSAGQQQALKRCQAITEDPTICSARADASLKS